MNGCYWSNAGLAHITYSFLSVEDGYDTARLVFDIDIPTYFKLARIQDQFTIEKAINGGQVKSNGMNANGKA